MALSGSTDFIMTRAQIVKRAFRLALIADEGQTLTDEQTTNAVENLNILQQTLQNDGIRLWKYQWITKTLTASSEVTGDGDSLNYECIRPHTASSTNRPPTGAEWKMYWVQRGSGGSTWVDTTAYTSICSFTLPSDTIGITEVMVRDSTDTPVDIGRYREYINLSKKESTGRPTDIYLDESIPPITAYLYPFPDSAEDIIHMLAIKKHDDFDSESNNPDFPVRWYDVLCYGLAAYLMDETPTPEEDRRRINSKFSSLLKLAKKGNPVRESNIIVRPWGGI
jgi:hypothetical protein